MNQTISHNAAARCGLDEATARRLDDSLADIFREALCGGDSVAIPAFGTFMPEKEDEQIVTDSVTGVSTLLPPHISVTFIPALKLAKSVKTRES